jgi:hypothetical protein
LLRFRLQKIGLSWPATGSKVERLRSPAPLRSILMTSAPWSASICVQTGPIITCVKSITRMPSSGRPAVLACLMANLGLNGPASAGTSALGPFWSPGSAPCARSVRCTAATSTLRTDTPAFSASAAATPAASPIAMQGGISREIFCAAEVDE